MDDRIVLFIDTLKKNLEGLPQEEIKKAVGYYEEYLNDAVEAGKDLESVLSQLGSPEKAAGTIRAEISILRAKHSPGLKNYTRVLRNATLGATAPLTVLAISIFVFISYCLVVMLFAGALASVIGAAAVALAFVYAVFTIPSIFALEIVGTIGFGLFSTAVLLLIAYGLYKLGRLFIVISSGLIGRMLKKSRKAEFAGDAGQAVKKPGAKRVVFACLFMVVAGLALSAVSGLPVKYFTIFNSMKPENLTVRTAEFKPGEISKLSIVTANSHIRLVSSQSDKITVTYEQPDWLDYELGSSGSMLSFYEKSNGRLPFYNLSSMHESRTELTIALPEGYTPEAVDLKSTGGYIGIERFTGNLHATTFTGNITLDFKNTAGLYDVEASTGTGIIEVDGIQAGKKTDAGVEYYESSGSGQSVKISSSRGNIAIKR